MCASGALALERSATMDMDTSRVELGASMQVEAIKAWSLAVLQGQLTLLNEINACGKQKKFWNGSACVAPVYQMTSPAISQVTHNLPVTWTFAYKSCTKKTLGVCTRHDNFCQSVCQGSAYANYTVNAQANTITVNSYVCNGAGQVKNVGNGGC